MKFGTPQWLWLLTVIPPLVVLLWIRPRDRSLPYTALNALTTVRPTLRQRLRWLPEGLIVAALGLVIVALASPQTEIESQRDHRQGLAIEILIDVSSSMNMPLENKDKSESRMVTAKSVLQRFVLGDGKTFKGLDGNLVGLVTFARYADTVCPLTFGCQALADIAADLDVSQQPNEDGTAYGDAVAVAAARLHLDARVGAADGSNRRKDEEQPTVASKVIILLTDGENNSGRHLPLEAAAMAKAWGIKVYTISLGQQDEVERLNAAGKTFTVEGQLSEADWTLKKMAEATGGIFRKAKDHDTLEAVYAEIGQLEKSEILTVTFKHYAPNDYPLVVAALACVVAALGVELLYLRRLA